MTDKTQRPDIQPDGNGFVGEIDEQGRFCLDGDFTLFELELLVKWMRIELRARDYYLPDEQRRRLDNLQV